MPRRSCSRLLAACLAAVFAALGLIAAAVLVAQPAAAQKRVALVVGNGAYKGAGVLQNPVNDASDMADAFKELGITVVLGLDLDKRGFDDKVRAFSRAVTGADAAILFYAGHGLQVDGRNYLVPTDAKLSSERDLDFETVSLDFIMRQMEIERDGKINIVFLDACRDNPLARSLARRMGTRSASVGRGLAEVKAGLGTFIAFATKPGEVALDGEGRNSPFTSALAKHVRVPGRTLGSVMAEVRREVLSTTGMKQLTSDFSSLTDDFYFHLASAPGGVPKALPPPPTAGAAEERLKKLEADIDRKAGSIAKRVELSQLKERARQLEEEGKRDQNLLFDTYRKHGPVKDAQGRMALNREVGEIQRRMAARSQQAKGLREEIAKLEAEVGPEPPQAK
jgi:hypothetical protein